MSFPRRYLLILIVFAACSAADFDLPNPEGNMPEGASGSTVVPDSAAYTHVRADGNRYALGSLDMAAVEPLVVDLDGEPEWVLGTQLGEDQLWVAALSDGRLQATRLLADGSVTQEILDLKLEPGQPFVLLSGRGEFSIEGVDSRTVRPEGNLFRLVGINPDGDLMTSAEGDIRQTAAGLDLLPDARLLTDERDRILLLTNPTDRYRHGVLGDAIEAAAVTLIQVDPELKVLNQIEIPAPQVVEGIMPIWADLNEDGQREIIVTLSDASGGAQLVVFNEAGEQVATSEPIGQGNRWRNQTAVAPFGPNGEIELADVRTPHLSGTVEFFRWEGDELVRVAALPGYTTHVIGSRNLDLGIAADVTGDGQVEVLLPTLARTAIAAIQRDEAAENGARAVWELPLNGRQSTNIGTITNGAQLSVAVGTDEGVLMVWRGE
ncbi:MAG: hypothetical protein QNJ45_19690 [Ardenticatenaceae bacterium]|nr:hypothetical protein [Ardenticatenaceae bacterium]